MKNLYLLALLFLSSVAWLNAQDTTSTISSDRPMFGEAVSTVPHKNLQVETGFRYQRDNNKYSTTQGLGLNSTLLRYGVGEKAELRFDYSLWQNRFRYKESPASSEIVQTGFLPIRFGVKANLIENHSWVPAVSFVGMLGLAQIASDDFQPEYLSPDLQLSFANAIGNILTLRYNLGARWDGDNPSPGTYYALATEFRFSGKFSAYVQGHGSSQRISLPAGASSQAHQIFTEAGLMFYPKNNIQVDLSGGIRVSEYNGEWISYNAERNYSFASVGLSWRFPR